jgi:hypothetical protein
MKEEAQALKGDRLVPSSRLSYLSETFIAEVKAVIPASTL